MAERSSVAFGRYLKMLRERRGLSLDAIYARSQSFPEPLMKGYLSRVENGHQKLAFPKMIPLSRILEVPSEVLVERMELDLELDKVGGPETEGKSYSDLLLAANVARQLGHHLDSYGCIRDAVLRASIDPVRESFRDRQEQQAIAVMSCACAAGSLGKLAFERFEFEYVESLNTLQPQHSAFLYSKLSSCFADLMEPTRAAESLERAVQLAVDSGHKGFLAAALTTKALHIGEDEPQSAIGILQQVYDLYSELGSSLDMARTLNNIGQRYFDCRNFRAARRVLSASAKLVKSCGTSRQLTLNRILLGEIEIEQGNRRAAKDLFKSAVSDARSLRDKTLRFKAEYQLLRIAQFEKNKQSQRILIKRLDRLAAWVPRQTPELREYKLSME